MSDAGGNGFVLRRNWFPVLAFAAAFAGGALTLRFGPDDLFPFALFAVWMGGMFGPLCYLRNAFPRRRAVGFRATNDGVDVDGIAHVAAVDVLEAKVLPRRGNAVLELALRDKRTIAILTSEIAARRAADLLGARRSRFGLLTAFGKRFVASVALLLVLLLLVSGPGSTIFLALPCLFWGLLVAWLAGAVRGRLVVGADGFTTRWLFRERFVAFRDVRAIEPKARLGGAVDDTLVTLASGETIRLRTVEAPNTDEERGAESRAMLVHLAEAFERSKIRALARVELPGLLERGGQSAKEWLATLAALVAGGGSRYRVMAVSADMLEDVASDPSASGASRAGAAAALLRIGDESRRDRVRILAEGCADADLRSALIGLADAGGDVEAEVALDEIKGARS